MTDRIRVIKHELVRSKCGSFEVRFADGRESIGTMPPTARLDFVSTRVLQHSPPDGTLFRR
jgi:hypothetical protein